MSNIYLMIGGIYHIGFIIFHIFFWKIFRWKADLRSLMPLNRGIMQVINLCLIFVFFIFAYISFFYRQELVATPLGKVMLLLIAIFWLLRAIEQIIFFPRKNVVSIIFLIIFLSGSALYLIPYFV